MLVEANGIMESTGSFEMINNIQDQNESQNSGSVSGKLLHDSHDVFYYIDIVVHYCNCTYMDIYKFICILNTNF